jgi:ABC-2 type transport system ATP-binding protein
LLQILACKKEFNGRQVLDILSLKLDKGVYWLRGINGSGKTTLLRMIAGLIPFKGDILLHGISLRSNPFDYRRKVSLAEAEPLYPPFITGQELVGFYRSIGKGLYRRLKN